jgi:hypothetical protein
MREVVVSMNSSRIGQPHPDRQLPGLAAAPRQGRLVGELPSVSHLSLFCRHNRFTAECPICSKGTVLDPNRSGARRPSAPRPRSGGKKRPGPPPGAARLTVGPYASAGPYERDDGERYEVRLERVPGGVRLGSWSGAALERRAPVLAAADVAALVREVDERELLSEPDRAALRAAVEGDGASEPGDFGASPGRAGDLQDELRVERLADGRVRVGRWLYRAGPAEWELQEAAPMLPAARFAEALASAVRRGVLGTTHP